MLISPFDTRFTEQGKLLLGHKNRKMTAANHPAGGQNLKGVLAEEYYIPAQCANMRLKYHSRLIQPKL